MLLSVVATETSAVTVISIPGIGARGDLTFLQVAIGYVVGRIAVAYWLLPGYFQGEQLALFNTKGQVFAIGNRCSHANGQLAEGAVKGTTVTCPYHKSQFDLTSGTPVCGPAARAVPAYRVKVDDGAIFLARHEALDKQPSASAD